MNSELQNQNLINFFRALDYQDYEQLFTTAIEYFNVIKSGDSKVIKDQYQMFLNLVQKYEESTGIAIISSPDESYSTALTALAGYFAKQLEVQQEKMRPVNGTRTFGDVGSADAWLSAHNNIAVNSLSIETRSTYGYFANHAVAERIHIGYTDYKRSTGYQYGMSEEETTSFVVQGNKEKFKQQWCAEHPGFEIVAMSISTNARANSESLHRSWSLDRAEHNTYFIVYRKKTEEVRKIEAALSPKALPDKMGQNVCPACGKPIQADYKFCIYCGKRVKPLEEKPKSSSTTVREDKKKQKEQKRGAKVGWFLSVLITLFGILAIIAMLNEDLLPDKIRLWRQHNTVPEAQITRGNTEKETIQNTEYTLPETVENVENLDQPEEGALYRALENVRLRSGPGTEYERLEGIGAGDLCRGSGEVSEDGKWIAVEYQGYQGWAFKEYFEKVEDEPAPENDEPVSGALSAEDAICLDGRVVISLEDYSVSDATITIRVQNNADINITTFGLPSIVINGRNSSLDPYANMGLSIVTIASRSYELITYEVDAELLTAGGTLAGEMHIMDASVISDRTYELRLMKNEKSDVKGGGNDKL